MRSCTSCSAFFGAAPSAPSPPACGAIALFEKGGL
jgi:hypothetical protein